MKKLSDLKNKQEKTRLVDKIYGGINMSWPKVILLAVLSAALTAVFLILPVFKGTSFVKPGETYEFWIFLAIFIIANCKKPLEAAFKTFVFFLISQPLIYLFQVPFSALGFELFKYYPFWLIITLLTFPAAFVAWFITKRNILSAIILAPVNAYLIYTTYIAVRHCISDFPYLIVTAVFCALQVIVYVHAFMPKLRQKMIGFGIPLLVAAAIIVLGLILPAKTVVVVPDKAAFSDSATIDVEDDAVADVQFADRTNARVSISGKKAGETEFTITDGEDVFTYKVTVTDKSGFKSISVDLTRNEPEG
ncbi:MAG: pilus assembly protein N-terminal domain-containing protein [Clostridia bacterium]|nr:pilus assembly protein N-terminal domain-containing protein [Clostridia bacterium]